MIIQPASPSHVREKALLVALETPEHQGWRVRESLEELGELVASAGGEVAGSATQRLDRPTAPYFIGKGKAEELARLAKSGGMHSIIFDDELSPAQARNLERLFSRKVLDRTQLILDIFAQRAKTREGKLQIELAQLQYLAPRLTRMWTHLSRQSGGIGTRGPGETQLEVDRRRVQERISRLERELEQVRKHRQIQRAGRKRHHWPACALVGYTNAGKSTLMNRLTEASVFAHDQLFATLDPTIRQFLLPNGQKVLISDTVGFIQKLPHHLIESFRATLEEVKEADVLIHVVDISNPNWAAQIEAVDEVLRQIGSGDKQTLHVFNKVDRLAEAAILEPILAARPHAVALSARTGQGVDGFYEELASMLRSWRMQVRLRIPQECGALLAELHRVGRVLDKRYVNNDVELTAHLPPMLAGRVQPYLIDESENPGSGGGRETTRAVEPQGA
ncbi:MAG: GTPase HflX [Candidatus Methylacidiphilales bacterium]